MKITIEPDDRSKYSIVSVQILGDDADITGVFEELVRPVMKAWFGYDALAEYLGEE